MTVLHNDPKQHETEFENGEFMRSLQFDDFVIELYQIPQPDRWLSQSQEAVGYRLFDGDELIFEGREYGCSPMYCIDSAGAFEGILGFLSLQRGDVDYGYWKRQDYTKRQLEWRDARAEELSLFAMDLREQMDTIKGKKKPAWACNKWDDSNHDWLGCDACLEKYHAIELH